MNHLSDGRRITEFTWKAGIGYFCTLRRCWYWSLSVRNLYNVVLYNTYFIAESLCKVEGVGIVRVVPFSVVLLRAIWIEQTLVYVCFHHTHFELPSCSTLFHDTWDIEIWIHESILLMHSPQENRTSLNLCYGYRPILQLLAILEHRRSWEKWGYVRQWCHSPYMPDRLRELIPVSLLSCGLPLFFQATALPFCTKVTPVLWLSSGIGRHWEPIR